MTVLIQFFHPYPERSRVNRAALDAVRDLPGVVVNDLYARYPNFYIDVPLEQELLTNAHIVVFQHPLYWYSGPALLKEWIDVVLEQGFAHGQGGTALRGKGWLHSTTTGMSESSYRPGTGTTDAVTMAELLKPFECTARFCGMDWLEPLVFHNAHAAEDAAIAQHGLALRRRLEAYL